MSPYDAKFIFLSLLRAWPKECNAVGGNVKGSVLANEPLWSRGPILH